MLDFREDETEFDRGTSCYQCGADIRDGNEVWSGNKPFCSERCREAYHETH